MNNYRFRTVLSAAAVILFITAFFYDPALMGKAVGRGLTICSSSVIPSLFPFMVVSGFLVDSGLCEVIGSKLAHLTGRIFGLPGRAAAVILMSLVGGYPVGAHMTAQLVGDGSVSATDGRRMLLFCVNAGPAFIIGTVGSLMLGSRTSGIILYASLAAASLLTGAVSGLFGGRREYPAETAPGVEKISSPLISSVSGAAAAMINVCAWIILFSAVTGFCSALPAGKNMMLVINAVLEVTNGCSGAAGALPLPVIALILGWGGAAVHCQLLPYLERTGMKYGVFLLSRLFNGCLAAAITALLLRLFPVELAVISTASGLEAQPYSVSVPSAAVLLALGAFAIMDSKELEVKRRL